VSRWLFRFKGCQVNDEAIVDISAVLQLLERVVDLVHSDHLAIGQDVFPHAEVEQLLGNGASGVVADRAANPMVFIFFVILFCSKHQ
jgi:hypothetical protein